MSTTALIITTPAANFPVTVAEAKGHLRITHAFDDAHIQRLIAAATAWAQDETGRIMMATEVKTRMRKFPVNILALPGGRITAVEVIEYTDDAGAAQTLKGPTSAAPGTDYQENLDDDEDAFLEPPTDGFWPAVQADTINAVSITYTVGYGVEPETCPESIRQGILFKLGDMYTVRDSEDAKHKSAAITAAENLLHPHRIRAA